MLTVKKIEIRLCSSNENKCENQLLIKRFPKRNLIVAKAELSTSTGLLRFFVIGE